MGNALQFALIVVGALLAAALVSWLMQDPLEHLSALSDLTELQDVAQVDTPGDKTPEEVMGTDGQLLVCQPGQVADVDCQGVDPEDLIEVPAIP